jgi:hypothetical protein
MLINCTKCNKRFKNEILLKIHNEKFKNCNIANYICELCNFKTNNKIRYNNHFLSKTHLLNEKNNQNQIIIRDYTCANCNHKFRDQYNLDRHLARKIPCHNNNTVINNITNNITNIHNDNSVNNTQINNNLVINVNNPNALLKNLNSLDSAYINNLNLSYSIDDPESLDRLREIIYNDPETKLEYLPINLSEDSNESIAIKTDINKKIVSNYIAELISKSFLNIDYPNFLPIFKNPKITNKHSLDFRVKSEGKLKIFNKNIIDNLLQLLSDMNKIQDIIEHDQDKVEMHYILEKVNKEYNLLKKNFDKLTLEYQNSEKIIINRLKK